MSLSHPNTPVSQQDLQDFYHKIVPYIGTGGGGGETYTASDGITIDEFNNITTDKSEEGDIDEIIGTFPSGGRGVTIIDAFNRSDLYSTDEKMIGQWYDGKPVYQKTVNIGALPSSATTATKAHDIANVDNIVNIFGIAVSSTLTIPLPLTATTLNAMISISANDTVINIGVGKDRHEYSGYVTLQYTKTTDSAVSIGEANEYSTDEKIIGTWIDGKPIYQKTWTGTVDNYSSITWQPVGSNVDKFVSCSGVVGGNSGVYTPISNGMNNEGGTARVMIACIDNTASSNANTFAVYCAPSGQTAFVGQTYRITIQYTKTTS